jgi:hypothetical protein
MNNETPTTRSLPSAIMVSAFAFALLMLVGCSGSAIAEQATTPTPADLAVHPRPAVATSPTECSTFEAVSEYQTYLTLSDGGMSNFKPLTDPEFVESPQADFLVDSDIVLGISHGDEHRAYPVRQVWYHHVVNDRIGGEPYLVTY